MNAPLTDLPQTSGLSLVRTLGVVAGLCGVIVVAAYQGSAPAVQENKRIALERAVFRVVAGAASVVEFHATPQGVQAGGAPPPGALKFYAAYGADGRLKGIAAEGAARGYADQVRVLYGYDPDRQSVVGLSVVQTRETPGIGDRVLADRDFIANFAALDVSLGADGTALANPVRTVKHGTKTKPWEVDAISGATVTSKAVGKAVNDSAAVLLPRLRPHLEELRKQP